MYYNLWFGTEYLGIANASLELVLVMSIVFLLQLVTLSFKLYIFLNWLEKQFKCDVKYTVWSMVNKV